MSAGTSFMSDMSLRLKEFFKEKIAENTSLWANIQVIPSPGLQWMLELRPSL